MIKYSRILRIACISSLSLLFYALGANKVNAGPDDEVNTVG